MKRILSLLLCIAVVLGCWSMMTVSAAGNTEVVGKSGIYSVNAGNVYHVSNWANYIFASTAQGLVILDANTEQEVARWSDVPAIRTYVTNDYIMTISGAYGKTTEAIIYRNPGVFTDASPSEVYYTFQSFNLKDPAVTAEGNVLYVVDRDGANNVTAYKIDADKVAEDAVDAVTTAEIGKYQTVWSGAEITDGYLTFVTYNNIAVTPIMTLYAQKVRVEDMHYEEAYGCVMEKRSMQKLWVDGTNGVKDACRPGFNMNWSNKADVEAACKTLKIYTTDGTTREETGYTVADLYDVMESFSMDITFVQTVTSRQVTIWRVQLHMTDVEEVCETFTYGGEPITEEMLATEQVYISFDFNDLGQEEDGTWIVKELRNEFKFKPFAGGTQEVGTITASDKYMYAYTRGGTEDAPQTIDGFDMFVINPSGDGISLVRKEPVNHVVLNRGHSIMAATVLDHTIIGTVNGVKTAPYILDITDEPDMSTNVAERVEINLPAAPNGNVYANMSKGGSRVYFALNDNTIAGVDVTDNDFAIKSKSEFVDGDAVVLHGTSGLSDSVTVTVDGGKKTELSSVSGAWSLVMENIANGTHTVTVTDGNESVSAEFTTYSSEMAEKETEVATAVANCADGAALGEYLEGDPDAAQFLGLDIEGSYSELDTAVQEDIMDAVLPLLKSGSGAAEKFDTEVSKAYKEKMEKEALEAVNDADKDTIGGVFETYKDILFATDDAQDVWEDYLKNKSKKSKIHKNFVGYDDCDDIDDVAKNLEKAIKKANEKEDEGGSNTGGTRSDKKEPIDVGYSAPKNPVTPVKPIETTVFGDVAKDYWGYEAITTLATRGIINGVGEGSFAPEETVTREAFVKMLVEALALKGKGEGMTFGDVDTNAWYTDYVYIASSIGLVNGYDGKFGIGDGLTREQMATMLYRAAEIAEINLEAKNDAKNFSDNAEIGEYAVEAVNALSQAGIINGMDNGTYAPKTVCNRAMAAKVIYEILAIK